MDKRKKISILSLHLSYGGIEKCVASLANILASKYDTEIICTYKLGDAPAFYIDPRVKIIYLLNEKPNRKEFKEAVKKHHFIRALKEGIKGFKILNLRKSTMINFIINSDSDVIISTRDIFDDMLGTYGKKDCLKIGWEHNHYHDNMKYAENVVRSCSKLDYLVLVSNSLNAFYNGRLRNTNCKTVFIPNIIEYIPKEDDISKLKNHKLISVGRLSREKGYLDLIKIFNIVHHDYPDWTLDIIGDGDEREKIEKLIKKDNLEDSVTLHGFRDKDYIYSHLHEASIYLMTSYTESFGIVLLEAMSEGLPCIAFSSAEGAGEIITSGSNGYLIKNRNFGAYIKKIEDLIENYDVRRKIGLEGRKTVRHYSPETVSKKWFKLIEKK